MTDDRDDRDVLDQHVEIESHPPEIVLVNRGRASDDDRTLEGKLLMSFDPDAYDGRGYANWTDSPARALRFDTVVDALNFWRQPSKVKPLRDDGRPNRPLTAYNVEPTKWPYANSTI